MINESGFWYHRELQTPLWVCHTTNMENKGTQMVDFADALRDYLCNNHTDLNDAVDWVCDTFDVNATDELIDAVADEFDSFFGL